jgi:DNA-binding NarL/FixJ family response regulator
LATSENREVAHVRLMVVDDDALFTDALVGRLASEDGFEVLPAAQNARQAYAILATAHPDVAVLDVALGGDTGIEVLDHIHVWHPSTRPLVLSATAGVDPVVDAVRHGTLAWVPKTAGGDLIVEVIRLVARGEAWIPPALLADVLRSLVAVRDADGTPDPLVGLSSREREILQCMVDGLGRAQTAMRLGVSTNTVRTHIRRLLTKLALHSTLEAAATALRAGMRPSGR